MAYPNSICVDIDDCISFTLNRDFDNAEPNLKLIEKLNKLYDAGWDIYYVTARGSLSCSSREEAELKYGESIRNWFKKHGVKYTELSFQKKLASYYIDDKGYKPDEFMDISFETIKTGMSGAKIELRDGKIYKTADNTKDVIAWFEISKKFFNVPKIHSVIGNTIAMEYIKIDSEPTIFEIIELLDKEQYIKSISTAPFQTYIDRISSHLNNIPLTDDEKKSIITAMKIEQKFFDEHITFSHGDFSLDNVLKMNDKLYLIDPIYSEKLYSSWLLDIGKLLHSLKRYNKTDEYSVVLNYYKNYKKQIYIAELTQWIRIYKYSTDELKQRTLNEIKEMIKLWTV